jgi:hypothetical protein
MATEQEFKTWIAAILATLHDVGGTAPASAVYVALGMDIESYGIVRDCMVASKLVTATERTLRLTDQGRALAEQIADAFTEHAAAKRRNAEAAAVQRPERVITRALVYKLIEDGYELMIDNGGDDDETEGPFKNADQALAKMFLCADEQLDLFRDGKWQGSVRLIYCNGAEVISDYTPRIEPVIQPVLDYVEQAFGG